MIDHLLSYSLSDFILFDLESYQHVLEDFNTDVFPAQIVFLILNVVAVYLLWKKSKFGVRFAKITLATAWLFVGLFFHWKHFVSINWAASYSAMFCLLIFALILLNILKSRDQTTGKAAFARTLLFTGVSLAPTILSALRANALEFWLTLGTSTSLVALTTAAFFLFERSKTSLAIILLSVGWLLLAASVFWKLV